MQLLFGLRKIIAKILRREAPTILNTIPQLSTFLKISGPNLQRP